MGNYYQLIDHTPSSGRGKNYTICLDVGESLKKKKILFSCNCKGWTTSSKRAERQGIDHRFCKHTKKVNKYLIKYFKEKKTYFNEEIHRFPAWLAGKERVLESKKGFINLFDTWESVLEEPLEGIEYDEDQELFVLRKSKKRKVAQNRIRVCPICMEESKSQEHVVKCDCGAEYM